MSWYCLKLEALRPESERVEWTTYRRFVQPRKQKWRTLAAMTRCPCAAILGQPFEAFRFTTFIRFNWTWSLLVVVNNKFIVPLREAKRNGTGHHNRRQRQSQTNPRCLIQYTDKSLSSKNCSDANCYSSSAVVSNIPSKNRQIDKSTMTYQFEHSAGFILVGFISLKFVLAWGR